VLLLCLPASAQLNLGRILGNISDQSGGVIVGATVTVLDVPRGVARNLTTDSAEDSRRPAWCPAPIRSRSIQRLQDHRSSNVEVGVGQDVPSGLTYNPAIKTDVTVTEAIPIIDTTNAVLSSTLQTEALSELPITAGCLRKCWISSRESMGTRAEIRRTTKAMAARWPGNYFLLDASENSNIFVNSGPLIGRPPAPTN